MNNSVQTAKQLLRSRRGTMWGIVFLVFALALGCAPILCDVGYPLAVCTSLLVSVFCLSLSPAVVEASYKHNDHSGFRAVFRSVFFASVLGIAMSLLPLTSAFLWRLPKPPCDIFFGLSMWLLLPCISSFFASAMGVSISVILGISSKGFVNKVPLLLFFVAVAGASLYWVYTQPSVRSYNPWIGYFHGAIYDDAVTMEPPLIAARTFQVSVAVFCAALASLLYRPKARVTHRPPLSRSSVLTLLGAGLSSLLLFCYQGALGITISESAVKERLLGHKQSENFVIRYDSASSRPQLGELLMADHEFRLAQIYQRFAIPQPKKNSVPITSFYFANPEQKYRFIGARNVHIAKPWRNQIYLSHTRFPHPSLRHEIAHVVFRQFSQNALGISGSSFGPVPTFVSMGLTEGYATVADWPAHGPYTPDEMALAMRQLQVLPTATNILSNRFSTLPAAIAYPAAASFVRFFSNHYWQDLPSLYANGSNTARAVKKTPEMLHGEWMQYLDKIGQQQDVPQALGEILEEQLRRKSVFQKPCAISARKLSQKQWEFEKIGQFDAAIATAETLCAQSPGNPRYQLQLASRLFRSGTPHHRAQARDILVTVSSNTGFAATLRARAYITLGDDFAKDNQQNSAQRQWRKAVTLPLSPGGVRQAKARLYALELPPRAQKATLRYLADPHLSHQARGKHAAIAVAAAPDSWLASYLLGINLHASDDWQLAAFSLQQAIAKGIPAPLFVTNAQKVLAAAAFASGDLPTTSRMACLLSTNPSRFIRLTGQDWLQRVRFTKNGTIEGDDKKDCEAIAASPN